MNSIEYLKLKQIQFKKINLVAIPKTANDVVKIYGCPLEQVLKTLVFIGRKEVIVVLQGDKKVNFKKLNLIIDDNYNKLRMATHKEIKKYFIRISGI
jgi:prolyl-tRNA editing enzyme YbaK/EbsC (Cys-tRNA(Pro) deacylase)